MSDGGFKHEWSEIVFGGLKIRGTIAHGLLDRGGNPALILGDATNVIEGLCFCLMTDGLELDGKQKSRLSRNILLENLRRTDFRETLEHLG